MPNDLNIIVTNKIQIQPFRVGLNITLTKELDEEKGVGLRFSGFDPLKVRSNDATITPAFAEDTKTITTQPLKFM
jgi:hypothetical protein